MDLSLASYIKVKSEITGRIRTYLIDTGASISVLKVDKLLRTVTIDGYSCKVSGVDDGLISTLGSVKSKVFVGDEFFTQRFHIVEKDFPIPCDGILGLDFISKYRCFLDYGDPWTLIIRPSNRPYSQIPMYDSPSNELLTLPGRCQVIRRVGIAPGHGDVYVPNQRIAEGVYVGRTIMTRENPFIRILNVNDNQVELKNVVLDSEQLDNYNVYDTPSVQKDRTTEILGKLQKNFPSLHHNILTKLCSEYSDVFALDTDEVTFNNFYKQKLHLKDHTPVYQRNFRLPHMQKPIIDSLIEKMRNNKILSPSVSEYNSPILLVSKKPLPGQNEKRYRFVVDYRLLNKKLLSDKFPLPRVDDILDRLGNARFFSQIDLLNGFHQIELDEESKDLTSFSTDKGSFKFNCVPFGLKVGPNSFQRMMTLAFSGLPSIDCFIYMDDLIVIAPTENKMLEELKKVFEVCRKVNLKLHPEKCQFFLKEVTFLGHKCTQHGILPDDTKIDKVLNYPKPDNADSARRFVAFCNYYRRFIKKFTHHAYHITRLTKKDVKFHWSQECDDAFHYLKNSLINPPILKYPDYTKQFCITTDASAIACGAVLTQEYDGAQMPIAFASRAFTPGERNKSTPEQELAAIHWALNHFKPYVYGVKFVLRTDHRPLIYMCSLKNPSSKLLRMRLDIDEFDFEIEHIRGTDNVIADALSRVDYKDFQDIVTKINVIRKVTTRSESRKNQSLNLRDDNDKYKSIDTDNIHVYEALDPLEVRKLPKLIFNFKIKRPYCVIVLKKKQLIKLNLSEFMFKNCYNLTKMMIKLEKMAVKENIKKIQLSLNDELFTKCSALQFKTMMNETLKDLNVALTPSVTLVKDEKQILNLLNMYHNDPIYGGHAGVKRLFKKLHLKYFWKDMLKDIIKFVQSCKDCQTNKSRPRTRENLTITPTPQSAFDIVIVDTIGPLPKSDKGNVYAVTLICDLTKYLVTIALPDKKAVQIAKAIFENFVLIFGPMKQLLSDRGSEYVNSILDDLCKLLNVTKKTSTSYHHRTVGTVERSHKTFNEYLRSYVNEQKSDWDDWLGYFTYCYNTTPSVAVNDYCPYQLIFGKTPITYEFLNSGSVDPVYNIDDYHREVKFRLQVAHQRAQKHLIESKFKRKIMYDDKSNPQELSKNDLILLEVNERHKLDPLFKGPYTIKEIYHPNVIITDDKGKEKLVHKDKVKLFNHSFYYRFK